MPTPPTGESIDSIVVTPDPATMTADGTVQLTAIVTYSDTSPFRPGESVDETKNSGTMGYAWIVSDDNVAYVNSGIWNGGLAVGRSAGTIDVGFWVSMLVSVPPTDPPPSPDDPVAPTDDWVVGWITLTVSAAPAPPPDPEGRFLLAFDDPATEPYPDWTRVDDTPNLVTSYTIDRGRIDELNRTDTGRATVQVADVDGVLDPTNPDGPYYGKIRPSMQAALGRRNPVTGEWSLRFRGFVEDFSYQTDPSQVVNRLTVSLVDQFDRLSRAEMQPGQCGDFPPAGSEGQIFYPVQRVEDRITRILSDFGIPSPFRAVLPGGVELWAVIYSAGESPLAAIQEAADGDFPGVSNVYCDRRGRLCFHSRLAKFTPDAVSAASGGLWQFTEWKAGDGAAVAASPSDTAQVRQFGFSRALPKIINSAIAYPNGAIDTAIAAQLVADTTSLNENGVCSWSATSLLTKRSLIDDADAFVETKRFASYYVANYKQAADRVQDVTFRPMAPEDPRAAANWQLLNGIDVADAVTVTVQMPGGGGFESAEYFVEGVHEEVQPLTPDYDDVTLRLDLSPRAYFATDPWA